MFPRKQVYFATSYRGVIVFNLPSRGNFDKLPEKFTFFETLRRGISRGPVWLS